MASSYKKPMRSVWLSLLWKEWHEHKWKLLVLTLMIFALPMLAWSLSDIDIHPSASFGLISGCILPYGILAGLFIGMGTAASENHRGTMRFLQTLPITMRKPAAAKLLLSLVTVAMPIFLLVGGMSLYFNSAKFREAFDWRMSPDLANKVLINQITEIEASEMLVEESLGWSHNGPFGTWDYATVNGWAAANAFGGAVFTASLLLWMATCGVNRADEIRAGAVGFLAIILFWGVMTSTAMWLDREHLDDAKSWLAVPMASAAGAPGYLKALSDGSYAPFWLVAASAILGHGFLVYSYLSRFGREVVRPARTMGKQMSSTAYAGWLGAPRRSQLTAIVWKQICETGPLALTAAVAVVVFAGIAYLLQDRESPLSNRYEELLFAMTPAVAFLVLVVAGMGIFLEDMKPRIGVFWRSRPIHMQLWFGVKFLTGLLVLAVSFGGLTLLAYVLARDKAPGAIDFADERFWIAAAAVILVFLIIYTLAMVSYCLLRHPVIAAITTILAFFTGMYVFTYIDRHTGDDPIGWVIVLGILQVIVTVVAWLTVRNNWGWESSR